MENLCEDLWVDILGRLTAEKDLVPCISVCKLWHGIASVIWVRRFWAQSPPLGLFYRTVSGEKFFTWKTSCNPTAAATTTTSENILQYNRMNYISLYNYTDMKDNLEDISHRSKKTLWQICRRQRYNGYVRLADSDQFVTLADRDEYLDGCNGLLLLLKSAINQFYICNPITNQQVAIPKSRVHDQPRNHFCAALAFDPSESPQHFRVVRIDFSSLASDTGSVLLDIFFSDCALWVRHRLQLDPCFIEGLSKSNFVYLRGKLYSIAQSWNLLCIDLNAVKASVIELPVPEFGKTGAMGCLGVSMDLLCYIKRMPHNSPDKQHKKKFDNLVVWYYDDRGESAEWTLKYTVECCLLGGGIKYQLYFEYDDTMEPYGISPSSDLLFFRTSKLIACYHLYSKKFKFVCTIGSEFDPSACFLTLRACFIPFYARFYQKNDVSTKLAMGSKDTEILSVEVVRDKQGDVESSVEVISVRLYDSELDKQLPTVYPSEIMEMHFELGKERARW